MRAGLAGLVERGFAASFVVEEEGFLPEGPDEVGGGATEERDVGAEEGGGSGSRFTSGDAEPLPTISTSDSTILLPKKRARIRIYRI